MRDRAGPGGHAEGGLGQAEVAASDTADARRAPVQMLGRQPELYKFVKQEKEKGWTEVTLKDGAGKAPIVIRRLINRSDKKSVWEINGGLLRGM